MTHASTRGCRERVSTGMYDNVLYRAYDNVLHHVSGDRVYYRVRHETKPFISLDIRISVLNKLESQYGPNI